MKIKAVIERLKKKLGFSWRNEFGIRFIGSRKFKKVHKFVVKKYHKVFEKLAKV